MFDANVEKVLSLIRPGDVVLDVGGWARCFNRANYVMDNSPYDTRGILYWESMQLGPQGGPVEQFTADTWIVRDICDRTPWPFEDKSIDYCVCSHTLEDIRDPLWVCAEMRRVARRGYIEVPSRVFEASRNREPGVPVGLCHHRWHCEVFGNTIAFSAKMHFIHGDPRHSIPESSWRSLAPEVMSVWLFWDDHFDFYEGSLGVDDLRAFAAPFIRPGEDISEADRLRTEVESLRAELGAAQEKLDAIGARFESLDDLGPLSIEVAQRLRNLSRRHPRIASTFKQIFRTAS